MKPFFFFFSSRRRHTRSDRDWSSDVCSSDLGATLTLGFGGIISALHAYGQESGAAGASSAQLAQQQFSDAQAIKGAREQITQAETAAAQSAASYANQLVSAEDR